MRQDDTVSAILGSFLLLLLFRITMESMNHACDFLFLIELSVGI